MPNADDYLNRICADIPDPHTRARVREELKDHLEERASDYLFEGLDEEAAYRKAEEDMGNPDTLAEELGKVHSFFPRKHFNLALTLLFWGLLLIFFQIDIWYWKAITSTIGNLLLLASLFMLRGSNQRLTAAWILLLAQSILGIVSDSYPLFPPAYFSETISRILLVCCNLLMIAMLFCLFFGLSDYATAPLDRRLRRCPYLYVLAELSLLLALVATELFLLYFCFDCIVFVILLVRVFQLRTDVKRSEREVPVKEITAYAATALGLIIACTAVLPVGFAAYFTNKPSLTRLYVQDDVGSDEETLSRVASVKERILTATAEYPAEETELFTLLLEDMRQSDLLDLEDAVNFIPSNREVLSGVQVAGFLALFETGTGRLFYYYTDESPASATRARQLSYDIGIYHGATVYYWDMNSRFVILCEKDGKTMELSPDYEYRHNGESSYGVTGVEFKKERGTERQRGYITLDLSISDPDDIQINFQLFLMDQCTFFRNPYNYDELEQNCALLFTSSSGSAYINDIWWGNAYGVDLTYNKSDS